MGTLHNKWLNNCNHKTQTKFENNKTLKLTLFKTPPNSRWVWIKVFGKYHLPFRSNRGMNIWGKFLFIMKKGQVSTFRKVQVKKQVLFFENITPTVIYAYIWTNTWLVPNNNSNTHPTHEMSYCVIKRPTLG